MCSVLIFLSVSWNVAVWLFPIERVYSKYFLWNLSSDAVRLPRALSLIWIEPVLGSHGVLLADSETILLYERCIYSNRILSIWHNWNDCNEAKQTNIECKCSISISMLCFSLTEFNELTKIAWQRISFCQSFR